MSRFFPESSQLQPVPVLSTEEPDLSDVPTHQGPRLSVWGSVFELHRGSWGVETFYLTESNNQTKVPTGLPGKKAKELSEQKVAVYM